MCSWRGPAASTGADATGAGAAESSEAPITLNVWVYPYWSGITGEEDPASSTPLDIWEHMGEKFQETHPNVSFNFEAMDWGTGRQKVNIAVASHSTPDILANEDGPVLMRYALMGVLAPIDDFLDGADREDFSETALDSASYGGHVMFWPWSQGGSYWIANKKIFEERNVVDLLPTNEDHSWDYEQFLEAAKQTTFSRSGGDEPDVYGVCISYKEAPGDYNRLGFLWGEGARVFSDDYTEMAINSPEAAAGLQYLYDLEWTHQVAVPGSAGLANDDCSNAFNQGKVAMIGAGPWISEAFLAAAEANGSIEPGTIEYYGILPPNEPGINPGVDGPLVAHAVFAQDDPAKVEAAMEFLHLVTSPEYMAMMKPSGNAAIRSSVGNLYEDSAILTWWQPTLKYVSPDQGSPFNKDMRASDRSDVPAGHDRPANAGRSRCRRGREGERIATKSVGPGQTRVT